MQMVGPWGRYLPQWLRAPGNGSGPAICQHTHTHTHWTLPTTMSVLETPFDIHVSSVYQTHTCMQVPIPTLCISAKKTHNKGSRTRPIMSTLMPRSGIPVICSRAMLSCDSSYSLGLALVTIFLEFTTILCSLMLKILNFLSLILQDCQLFYFGSEHSRTLLQDCPLLF